MEESFKLVRDFHDWDLLIGIWRDPGEGVSGVTFRIAPKGFTANLPAPSAPLP